MRKIKTILLICTLYIPALLHAGFSISDLLLYSRYCSIDGITVRNNIGGHGPSTDGIDTNSSSFNNIHINTQNAGSIKHAQNWTIENYNVISEDNKPIQISDSKNVPLFDLTSGVKNNGEQATPSELCNKKVYLFSYFMGNGESGLHMAYSFDGLVWETLNNGQPLLKPMVGKDRLMRDPSIVKGKNGIFHMVWTTGWWDQYIGYASSKDLVNWSEQRTIPVMYHEPETRNAWAPEIFYNDEEDLYYIIWASTIPGKFPELATSEREKGLNHRQYVITTKNFETFSETKLFFDPGFSVIDAAIIKIEDSYWMILKNENSSPAEKNLRITFTKDLKKGFPTEVSENISGNSWAEGPSPLKINEHVNVYFDKYTEKKYGAIRSKDGNEWEDISAQIVFPNGTRHGTAFEITDKEFEKIKKFIASIED